MLLEKGRRSRQTHSTPVEACLVTVRFARQLAGLLLIGGVFTCASPAWACDVPVFRYALEYWPAAPYQVDVLSHTPLSAREREALQRLDGAPSPAAPRANAVIRLADPADPSNASSERLWRELGSPALPLLVLHDIHTRRPIWSGPLTASNAAKLVDSPARREVARRILEGHSAVWVLLESGDRAKDSAAKARLETTLRELEQTLKLPDPQGSAPFSGEEATAPPRPPLQLRFSFLTVSRGDPAESVFAQLLLHTEQDLDRYSAEPMVFPVYGRGRVLYALVGRGITRENLEEAGRFLIGACSCEAKEENPGTDLLIAADWEGRLIGSAAQAAGPQPLVGLATLSQAARAAKAAPPEQKASAPQPGADTGSPNAAAPRSSAPPQPTAARPVPSAPGAAPEAPAPVAAEAGAPAPAPPRVLLRNMLLALGALAAAAALLGVLAARRRPEGRA
jgi:hypothetical protein